MVTSVVGHANSLTGRVHRYNGPKRVCSRVVSAIDVASPDG